jgi:hypothetical protein
MKLDVLGLRDHLQVLATIVGGVTVDVVDDLRRLQMPCKVGLNYGPSEGHRGAIATADPPAPPGFVEAEPTDSAGGGATAITPFG